MANEIKCPKCGTQISISEVLSHQLNEQIKEKVAKKLADEKALLEVDLKKQFADEQAQMIKKSALELEIKEKQLENANQRELESLKAKAVLEAKLKQQEIEITKRVEAEKQLIEEKIRKEESERTELKMAEKDKKILDMARALAEAQRKAQQGSMQTQGEVLELSLEESLRENFPIDLIEEVPKGVTGADIIQKVYTRTGQHVGTIAWEAKQTKAWTEDWVDKLKTDGRNIGADVCILLSAILPKGMTTKFGFYRGVWVCSLSSVLDLTHVIRNYLEAIYKIKTAQNGRDEKKDILYNYLCSAAFVNRVENTLEVFANMKLSLEKEKAGMLKVWAQREMQLNRLQENTAKMFGDIEGIAGIELNSNVPLELAKPEEVKEDSNPKANKKSDDQFQLFNQ